jgi:hypothetical protein
VSELLRIAVGYPCACKGPVDGEPECFCKMNSKQVRRAVSLAALKRGNLVRLNMNNPYRPPHFSDTYARIIEWLREDVPVAACEVIDDVHVTRLALRILGENPNDYPDIFKAEEKK